MDALFAELSRRNNAAPLAGYLNFSDGRPDAKFRKAMVGLFWAIDSLGVETPFATAGEWLRRGMAELENSGQSAFRDLSQARQVIEEAFTVIPHSYRAHHRDLLAHQSDENLFNAYFACRCCELALAARSEGLGGEQLPGYCLHRLNDYIGYRPIAVLETRPQTEFYPHEKVGPILLMVQGVGIAPGPHAALVRPALELLASTDADLLREACFEPELLSEMALDPRAVDHFHPLSKRPSMLFGEWDPHQIDNQGYYRRFVLREPTLIALRQWAETGNGESGDLLSRRLDPERLFEAAAVLAGTILMGAGVSGSGPGFYDSTVTLPKLVSRIARYRDDFYQHLLRTLSGHHGERLRAEAEKLKQPFAGVRQHLNQAIASERALHLQERRLGILFSAMGYPNAARERARKIPAPSVRFGCEVRIAQTEASFAVRQERPGTASEKLERAEDLLRRGIECGALIDPWNILGYQGLFPTFSGRADTVRDPRAEELILNVGRQFDLYSRGLAAAAALSDGEAENQLRDRMEQLADWWDQFATVTVSDLPRVHGGERAEAARHVAKALALWRSDGATDPGFWRKHREGFRTPSAYYQVIEALIDRPDYRASLALLVTWLYDAETVPLQDPSASFFRAAFRWMRSVLDEAGGDRAESWRLVRRFFELLEANAEDRWHVPQIGPTTPIEEPGGNGSSPSDSDTFASAYEDVTYKDSADDGQEGALADEGPPEPTSDFPLEEDAQRIEERLRFLASVAMLWRTAARPTLWPNDADASSCYSDWLHTALRNYNRLQELSDELQRVLLPEPIGGVESVIEFERRRGIKSHLIDMTVQTSVEVAAAARALSAGLIDSPQLPMRQKLMDSPEVVSGMFVPDETHHDRRALPAWESPAIHLERAIATGDSDVTRRNLTLFLALFRHEPLLVTPPSDGGLPRDAVRAQSTQQQIESLLARLPRIGLLRETYQLLKLARSMERNTPPEGRRVSSFDQLFRTAVVEVVDAVLHSAEQWPESVAEGSTLADTLRTIAESFYKIWVEHSQSLRLSSLENYTEASAWNDLKQFVSQYGGDLFTVPFLTLANIRGIIGQGVANWLDRQSKSGELDHRPALLDDWEAGKVDRRYTAKLMETVLQALVEHYDEYRDYNTTTTQSDYGENLYILLDFLRLVSAYDRYAWRLKPFNLTHERLCRRGFDRLAVKWRETVVRQTRQKANELLAQLSVCEAEHGVRLRTVRDRLEERFLHPLLIDQAAARVARAAKSAQDGQTESNPAYDGLLAAIQPLADQPAGVGLDVPAWLRRLEEELKRFKSNQELTDGDSGDQYPFPEPVRLSQNDVLQQLEDWERPLAT